MTLSLEELWVQKRSLFHHEDHLINQNFDLRDNETKMIIIEWIFLTKQVAGWRKYAHTKI